MGVANAGNPDSNFQIFSREIFIFGVAAAFKPGQKPAGSSPAQPRHQR
jgi:hypothetical protein